jgi:IclR family acetate operon transcriptional repressor
MQSSIVDKLLQILTLVSEATEPQSFSQLVAASNLHKSTMHRILSLGMESKMLRYDEQTKTYLLGSKVFDLVKNAYRGHDIQSIALNEMVRLHKLVCENITIGVPSGIDTVYLRLLEAPHTMGAIPQPGMREPFHCSASGKAIMAFRHDSIIWGTLQDYCFEKFTSRTITSAKKFKKVLDQVRVVGYATNDREEYEHFVGISAPIFNYLCEPIAVLNIWCLHQRKSIKELSTWSDELLSSAARVTDLVGGEAPSLDSLVDEG